MQTTLRIDDDIYRRAKSLAAQEGITLTKFIEEALDLRIDQAIKEQPGTDLPGGNEAARKLLIRRLNRLYKLADDRDRLKEGSAGPFSREEAYAERLDRIR